VFTRKTQKTLYIPTTSANIKKLNVAL